MKKICLFIFTLLLVLSFSGCSYEEDPEPQITIPEELSFVDIIRGANFDVKVIYSEVGNYYTSYFYSGKAVETEDGFQVILDFKNK